MKYQATITELYSVTWPIGEDGSQSTKAVWFEEKADADKVAALPLGSYNCAGMVMTSRFINGEGAPKKAHPTALEWAKENLTYNDMIKHGFKP